MASQASSPPPPGARWSDLVKASLHPRLLRLPLLGFTLVHSLLAATYLPSTLASGSLLDFVLLPIRPDIALASLLAFALGVMPLLVVRRRILARTRWHQALVTPYEAPFASPASLLSRPSPSTLKAAAKSLSHPSTWTSALLSSLTASAFTLPILAAFAFASKDPLAWSPYHQVPSVRKVSSSGTFGGVRSHTTTTLYWRPNEVVFALALQPFFLGILASLASTIFQDWPVPPLRIPVFPFLATVEAIEAGAASGPTPSSSLAARVTATVPRRVAAAAAQYALLSTAILTLYLPVRLPLFRTILLLLPPYSALRRLVIPSLHPQYSIYSAGNLAFLFGTAALLAAILGAAQSLAANLWEIYATHPLAIVASGNPALIMAAPPRTSAGPASAVAAATPGVETLLEALEVFASTSPLSSSTASAYGAQERHFLFMHALLDLASLAQHLAAEGDSNSSSSEKQRRGQFWKHFAVPATAAAVGGTGGTTTVSAWERVSEVGLREIKAILEAHSGATSSGGQKPAQAAASAAPKATTTVAIEPASRALKAAAPSTSTAMAQARPQAPAATTATTPAGSQATATQPTTIWQRLLAPPPSASTSSSNSTAVTQQRRQSTPTPSASTPAPTPTAPTTAPTSSISLLLTRFFGSVPPSNSSSSASSHPPSASSSFAAKSSLTSSSAPLLLLLLAPYSAQTLLLLSLREDEWGSVTLSERRGLGVEAWQRVAAMCREVKVVPMVDRAEGNVGRREEERQREWDVARDEVERRSGMIGSEFGTGGGQSG